jgi:hypothetical protein
LEEEVVVIVVRKVKRETEECATDLQNKIGCAVKRILMPAKNP